MVKIHIKKTTKILQNFDKKKLVITEKNRLI